VCSQNDDCIAVLLEITAVCVILILSLSLSDELILEKRFSFFSSPVKRTIAFRLFALILLFFFYRVISPKLRVISKFGYNICYCENSAV